MASATSSWKQVFSRHFGQVLPYSLPLSMVAKVIRSSLPLCDPFRDTDDPLWESRRKLQCYAPFSTWTSTKHNHTHECTEEGPFSPSLSSAFALHGVSQYISRYGFAECWVRAAGIPAPPLFLIPGDGYTVLLLAWLFYRVLKLTLAMMVDYGCGLRDRKKIQLFTTQ